jgi:hypothetical protein
MNTRCVRMACGAALLVAWVAIACSTVTGPKSMSGTWQITPFFVGGRSTLVYLQQSGDNVAGLWDIEYPYPVDAQLPPFCGSRSAGRVDLPVAVATSFAGSFTV